MTVTDAATCFTGTSVLVAVTTTGPSSTASSGVSPSICPDALPSPQAHRTVTHNHPLIRLLQHFIVRPLIREGGAFLSSPWTGLLTRGSLPTLRLPILRQAQDSGIVQSDSPLTVAGPCWLCPAAACGWPTTFPCIQGHSIRPEYLLDRVGFSHPLSGFLPTTAMARAYLPFAAVLISLKLTRRFHGNHARKQSGVKDLRQQFEAIHQARTGAAEVAARIDRIDPTALHSRQLGPAWQPRENRQLSDIPFQIETAAHQDDNLRG